jgi:hypothetical protein
MVMFLAFETQPSTGRSVRRDSFYGSRTCNMSHASLPPLCFLHRSILRALVYIYPAVTLDLTIIHQPSHSRHRLPLQWTPSTTPTVLYTSLTQSPLAHRYYSAQVLTTKSSTTAIRKTSNLCSTAVIHPCTDPCNLCFPPNMSLTLDNAHQHFPLNMNLTLDNVHQHGPSRILTSRPSWTTTSTSFAPALLFFLPSSKQA